MDYTQHLIKCHENILVTFIHMCYFIEIIEIEIDFFFYADKKDVSN